MQLTAVYSCVRILAEAIAGLPLHVYRQRGDGGKEKALDHPLYRLLHDEPNPEMTSFVFRETLMTHRSCQWVNAPPRLGGCCGWSLDSEGCEGCVCGAACCRR
ncbi:phage portal protein, partial [Brevibacterium ravenspurgense]